MITHFPRRVRAMPPELQQQLRHHGIDGDHTDAEVYRHFYNKTNWTTDIARETHDSMPTKKARTIQFYQQHRRRRANNILPSKPLDSKPPTSTT
jgi:hypothetical protein